MPETSPLACDAMTGPVHPTPVRTPAEASPSADELDILNDNVLIEVSPDRPCGTIRVKLVYAGRSTPIPADDPWAE
jgi:hypothetical protein